MNFTNQGPFDQFPDIVFEITHDTISQCTLVPGASAFYAASIPLYNLILER